jgi:3-hydroxybutyryl-CoA dehydrogenase
VTDSGGRGTSNAKGFYRYTPAQAKRWEKLFRQFSFRIRDLAKDYPEDVGDRSSLKRKRTT